MSSHKTQTKIKFCKKYKRINKTIANMIFRNTHKSQVKMFETIGVLIIFFILLSIGISVYFMLQKSSYAKDTEQRRQLQAFSTVQKMLYMPELDCINVF